MEDVIQTTRRQAAARGLEHELVVEDVAELWEYQNGRCFWLNVEVSRPTLVELIEGRGFTAGNVALCARELAAQRHGRSAGEMADLVQRLGKNACAYFRVSPPPVRMSELLEKAVRPARAKPVKKTCLQQIDEILAIERAIADQ